MSPYCGSNQSHTHYTGAVNAKQPCQQQCNPPSLPLGGPQTEALVLTVSLPGLPVCVCVWAAAPPSKKLPDPAASTRPAVTQRLMLQGGATPQPWSESSNKPPAAIQPCLPGSGSRKQSTGLHHERLFVLLSSRPAFQRHAGLAHKL